MKFKISYLGLLFKAGILFFLTIAWMWGSLAIFFVCPDPEWLKILAATLFATLLPVAFLFTRSFFKGLVLSLVFLAGFSAWWQNLQPTHKKEWAADVAQVATGEIHDNKLTMHNVRNFSYIVDEIYDEKWETEERWETLDYNLDNIQGLDLFLSYCASEHIAHAILSWDFGHDQHLAISIEPRKDTSQEYSAIKGFFKQFELSYVAANEKDIIRLRTNFKKERVYAYSLQVSKEQAKALLQDYVKKMNNLAAKPAFYDALTRNYTTANYLHTKTINSASPPPMDWKIFASGHLDELLYEKGILSQRLPFATLRQQSRIDQRMQAYGEEHYSRILRYDLPMP